MKNEFYIKLKNLPEEQQKEVSNFVDSLHSKSRKKKPVQERKAGLAKGLIKLSEDFDEPLQDFEKYM